MSPSAKKALKPRFLLDENIDIHLSSYLKKHGFRVLLCPKGITNGAIISLAKEKSSILLTNDKDFADSNFSKPSKDFSIIVFRIHPPKLENLTKALNKLLSTFSLKDLFGKIIVLGEKGIEIIGE